MGHKLSSNSSLKLDCLFWPAVNIKFLFAKEAFISAFQAKKVLKDWSLKFTEGHSCQQYLFLFQYWGGSLNQQEGKFIIYYDKHFLFSDESYKLEKLNYYKFGAYLHYISLSLDFPKDLV